MGDSIELRSLDRSELPAARGLLERACAHDRAGPVAAEKLFGPAPGHPAGRTTAAWLGDELVGVTCASARWIRLLAVAPEARGRGLGTVLLAAAESDIARTGGTTARTGDQPGNYLAPGIDQRNTETIAWFERRGYAAVADNTNLLIEVTGNPRVSAERLVAAIDTASAAGYELRRAGPADAASLADVIGRAFSLPWAFEVERALGAEPAGVHVALRGGELAAFAAHDGNNRGLGWFGPAGTLPEHRGKGLGEALLLACLLDVAAAGHPRCEVAWIGPRRFYERVAGIAGERRFTVLQKGLS